MLEKTLGAPVFVYLSSANGYKIEKIFGKRLTG